MEIHRATEVQKYINDIFDGKEDVLGSGEVYMKGGIHQAALRYPDNYLGQQDYLLGLAAFYAKIRDAAANEVVRLEGEAGVEEGGGRRKRKTRRRGQKKQRRN